MIDDHSIIRRKPDLITADVDGERLDRPQSYISKVESGQRRVDLVELDPICRALSVSVVTVVTRWSRNGDAPKGR